MKKLEKEIFSKEQRRCGKLQLGAKARSLESCIGIKGLAT